MPINTFYIYALIFTIVFIKLFIENFNKKYILFVPRPLKGDYPIKIRIQFAFIRSFYRAFVMTLILYLFVWALYGIYYFLSNFFQNLSSILFKFENKTVLESVIKSYYMLLGLPANTYYGSLVIATMFSVYSITSFIFIYIKKTIFEIREELLSVSVEKISKEKKSLDKIISDIFNPPLEGLNSFHYEKSFLYKKFIFSENLGHLISITILWNIQKNPSINLYILIISLLIITYSTLLRVVGEYLYIIKDKLTLVHKIQIYVVSVVINIASIILGFIYLEKDLYYLIYGLIIIVLYSTFILNYGEKFTNKMKKGLKESYAKIKQLKKFAYTEESN